MRGLRWIWLLAFLLVLGCASKAPLSVPSAVPGAGAATVNRGEFDCARLQRVICDTAGDKSKECESATNTFTLVPASACAASGTDEDAIKAAILRTRQPCSELVMRACRDLGPETATCTMVVNQTKPFPPERCTMMLRRYSEVLAELRKMEATNQPLSLGTWLMLTNTHGPTFGPPDAKVVIVEFTDFECPFCAKAADVKRQVRANYPSNVRIVTRQFPLTFHKQARLAAEAALAANAQGKFWQLHDMLYANQKALKRADIDGYAASVGLNMKRFKKDLDGHRFAADIDTDIAIAEKVGVSGTPTMFINERRITNPGDAADVLKQIDQVLAQ